LGFFAGMRGKATSRAVLLALPAAWLCGGALGSAWRGGGELQVPMILSFGLVGAMVAFDLKMPRVIVAFFAGVAGLIHGYADGTAMTGRTDWLLLTGASLAVFVMATLLPALIVSLRQHWMRIVVRVAGSWIAAIAMLMFGWIYRAR